MMMTKRRRHKWVKRSAVLGALALAALVLAPPAIRQAGHALRPAPAAQPGRLPAIVARARADHDDAARDLKLLALTEGRAGSLGLVRRAGDNLAKDVDAMANVYKAAQLARTQDELVDVGSQLSNVMVQITNDNAFARRVSSLGTLGDQAADAKIVAAYGLILGALYDANEAGHGGRLAYELFGPGHGLFGQAAPDTGTLSGKAGQFGRSFAQASATGDYDQTAIEDSPHLAEINQAVDSNYVKGLYLMLEQFTSFMAQQIGVIGGFMDAKIQLDAQRDMQDMDAQAHKDYEPSTQMCIIGTNARSLAMSDQKGRADAQILSNTMLQRSLLTANGMTAGATASDMTARKAQYIKTYCEGADNSQQLKPFCGSDTGASDATRRNRDIDYEGLVNSPLTLDADFTDATLTHDEEDILAMSRNLFANDPAEYVPSARLIAGPQTNMGPGAWLFQDMRSLQAIRGVAQNSFAHIVGMKAKGGDQIYPFASQIIKELGVQDADLTKFIGQNPSYFAQMDILTKRIEMAPDFYVNLFTSPANVNRMGVTLQAIKLMNDRDRYESSLRREMLISLIVEMKIRDAERPIDNKVLGALPTIYTW